MTDTKEPQFCARLKTGGFTRTASAKEVFESLQRLLPVDTLYIVLPHPDGKGYELLETGQLVVDFTATHSPTEQMRPPSLSESPRPLPPIPHGQQDPFPTPQEPTFTPNTDYQFEADTAPAETQEAIAKRMGYDQPKAKAAVAKKVKKSKSKRAARVKPEPSDVSDQCNDDPNDTSWLKGLPAPVRVTSPGAVSISNIRQASPEEAKAASHFGKGF